MKFRSGNLFDSKAVALGHGVNTRGLMGAGIAKTFKEKYPDNYHVYSGQCAVNGLKGGDVLIVPALELDGPAHLEGVRVIVNMASQEDPGPVATYKWLFESTYAAAKQLCEAGISVCAIPEIGCGIGGLKWDKVETVLLTVEYLLPGFEWEVWTYAP